MLTEIKCARCGAPFAVGLARWQVQWDGVLDRYAAVLACAFRAECRERARAKESRSAADDNRAA